MSDKKNILKYKSLSGFNIGFVIFFIIIIYVLFNVFSYFTDTHVAEYEVSQGTIASNYVYQGVIVRDESVEYAKKDGYINYYIKNGTKVSTTDVVYSVDTVGTISEEISSGSSKDIELSTSTLENLSKEISIFVDKYNGNKFYESYDFLENVNSEITHTINNTILNELSAEVNAAENNNTFFKYTSPKDGIIVYHVDGYEDKTIEDHLESDFTFSDYNRNVLASNREISVSDPVYKRVNSESWNILIQIDETLAKELEDFKTIKIRFCKDDFTTNANCQMITQDDDYFLQLSLKTAMIRYINERFVDIELVMKDKEGLKIPKSAITSKEFFTIPKEFFTLGGDSDEYGLLVKQQKDGKDMSVSFITPTIYYESVSYYYIDNEEISAGDIVLLPDSVSTYIVGDDVDDLDGVYNINKGYAVFKQINIIYENEEYAIVETKTSYGVTLYDHIALDASTIKENQLIAK